MKTMTFFINKKNKAHGHQVISISMQGLNLQHLGNQSVNRQNTSGSSFSLTCCILHSVNSVI